MSAIWPTTGQVLAKQFWCLRASGPREYIFEFAQASTRRPARSPVKPLSQAVSRQSDQQRDLLVHHPG